MLSWCLLDVCLMFASSCKQPISVLIIITQHKYASCYWKSTAKPAKRKSSSVSHGHNCSQLQHFSIVSLRSFCASKANRRKFWLREDGTSLSCIAEARANPDAKRLYTDLLVNNGYNKLIRPVGNNSDKLTVKLGLRLSQLIDVVSNTVDRLDPPWV